MGWENEREDCSKFLCSVKTCSKLMMLSLQWSQSAPLGTTQRLGCRHREMENWVQKCRQTEATEGLGSLGQ